MSIETYIPDDYLAPGHFIFAKFGGAFGPSGAQRKILVVGPKTADGTGTVNTVYAVQDDNHSDQLCGIGGPTAAACRAARSNYSTAPIYVIITEDNAGGVAASGTITPAGTATSDGTLTAKACGRTYTTTIETGDTAEIVSEKLNLILNPTLLAMACRMANELKADYNTHKNSAVYHTAADPGNLVAAAAATNEATLVTLANDVRTCYEAHRVLVGGGPCHGQADATNAVSAAACTDLATAVVLVKDLKAKFNAHIVNTDGVPAVHIASDTTDTIVSEDPVAEQHAHLPFTSLVNPAGPQVDLEAKFEGPDGNNIFVRVSTDAGGVTFTQLTDYHLGSGANQADYSSALAVAMTERYHYIIPVANDAATLAAATVGLKDRLTAAEAADVGLRMQAIIGYNGTPVAAETLADSFDYYRMQIVSLETDTPPWEVAGAFGGLRCMRVASDLSVNLAWEKIIGIVPPEDQSDYPTTVEINNAMHEGVSLLRVTSAGDVQVTYSITTKHTNGAGAEDLSVWGTHKVDVHDALADDIVTKAALKYVGFKLIDNPSNPSTIFPAKTTCPDRFETFLQKRCQYFEDEGHLKAGSVAENEDNVHAEINGANPNRLDFRYPADIVDHFLTSSGVAEQIG